MKRKNFNPLNVKPGDVVHTVIKFDHEKIAHKDFEDTVKSVVPDYLHGHVVTFINNTPCNICFVKEIVVSYRGYIKPFNKFSRYSSDERLVKSANKNILCSPISFLCEIYLSKLNHKIETTIDHNKLRKKLKTLTGIVSIVSIVSIHSSNSIGNIVYVKKSHFEKWFKRNWRFILSSINDDVERLSAFDRRADAAYEKDMYMDYEQDRL